MPTFRVTDPQTGQTLKLTGDSPPTEVELEEIFSQFGGTQDAGINGDRGAGGVDVQGRTGPLGVSAADQAGREGVAQGLDIQSLLTQFEQAKASGDFQAADAVRQQISDLQSQAIRSDLEAGAAIASGAVAEPAAGLAGILQGINPFAAPGAGAEAVEATREALTFQPRTEGGQEALQAVGGVVEPIAQAFTTAEKFLGDKTFEVTGSPTLAAAAATIPTAISEILGVAGAKGAIKVPAKIRKAAFEGKITREITEAVPTIDQLKDTSRAVYQEIDDLGAAVKPESFERLVDDLKEITARTGIDPDITPKAAKALKRFDQEVGGSPTLSEVDTLRQVAQNAASSIEKAESAMGMRIIDTVDQFLDTASPSDFSRVTGDVSEISKRYKVARDLWGRSRRSELINEAFDKARLQASGFENGIRTQFRSIINNKKQKRFFSPEEQQAMLRVVKGGKKENFAKLVGRLGFSEGGATNIIGSSLGIAGGAAVGGPAGALIVPAIGQVSRSLAGKMTAKNAEFADQVIRAGKDARKITSAYIRNTPKGLRDPAELSELLMRPDINLADIQDIPLASQASQIAQQQRAALGGAIAPQLAPEQEQQNG